MAKRASTLKDILSVDFDEWNRWDEKQLREKTTILISAANKRIASMEKANQKSPAYRSVMRGGGKFSIAGKTFDEVKQEYVRVKKFLEQESSSVRGWRKIKRETIQSMKKEIPDLELTESEFDDFFDAYDKLTELDENAESRNIKYSVWKELSERMKDKTKAPEQLATEMKDRVTELYEKNQREQQSFNRGVSEYFK